MEENTIKKISYEDIFSVETDNLIALSNNLSMLNEIDQLSKEFFELNSNTDSRDFLYQRIYMKDSDSNIVEYFSYLNDLNFLFKNIINFTNEKSIEVIKQSFPEKTPLLFRETIFKLFS